jgi:ribosomal protein L37AE/L43A
MGIGLIAGGIGLIVVLIVILVIIRKVKISSGSHVIALLRKDVQCPACQKWQLVRRRVKSTTCTFCGATFSC